MTPVIISTRGIEKWMHRYGSEAPDSVFIAAFRAWLSSQTVDQSAYRQSAAFREQHYADMREFKRAIGLHP